MRLAVVTGGRGFIGSVVVRLLEDAGWRVRVIDVRPGQGTIPGDVARPGAWVTALRDVDLLVHTAAIVAEGGDPARFWRVNVEGTRTVLDLAAAADVGRVVHLSSTVVYGREFRDGVDETATVRMTGNPYTDTKVAAEHHALRMAASGRLEVVIVRPGDVYGPGSVPWTIRPLRLLGAGLTAVPDAGRGVLAPVYVDDVARGVVAAATTPEAGGEIINLAPSRGVTVSEFLDHYAEALGVRLRSAPAPLIRGAAGAARGAFRLARRDPPLHPEVVEYLTHPGTYSNAKAEQLLGWQPQVDLDEGMRRTLAWARAEGLVS